MVVTITFDTRRCFHLQYVLFFGQKLSFLSPFPSGNQERSSVLGHGVAPLAVVLSQGWRLVWDPHCIDTIFG